MRLIFSNSYFLVLISGFKFCNEGCNRVLITNLRSLKVLLIDLFFLSHLGIRNLCDEKLPLKFDKSFLETTFFF